MNVGIIGNGFVGSAVAQGFSLFSKIRIYDNNESLSSHSFEDVVTNSDFIFVCVPTPSDYSNNKSIDLTILNEVIEKINKIIINKDADDKVIILKSTIIPGTTENYSNLFPKLRLVFNPEFLSEKTALFDFNNPSRIILGGDEKDCKNVKKLYRMRFPHVNIIMTDSRSAEFTKYACNCFFAAKIAIFNELRQMADSQNMNWDAIMNGILSSGWVNPMHTLVPGTDGNYGFGGKCFPKDINAFINYYQNNDINPTMFKAAWDKNIEVRKNKDWLKIEGAFSNKGEENE
jgi:nucleotide sugar dehydrogenase